MDHFHFRSVCVGDVTGDFFYIRQHLVFQVFHLQGPDSRFEDGPVGDDVGSRPAFGDDGADDMAFGQGLFIGFQAAVEIDEGVEGIDAVIGGIGHVGCLAEEGELQGVRRIRRAADIRLIRTGMDDDRRFQAVEDAVFAHIDLAAHRFFSRTAVDMDRRLRTGRFGKGQGCADAHGRDEVVAAAMADFRQGIVFGQKAHLERTVAADSVKGRRKGIGDGIVDGKAVVLQDFFQRRRSEDFVHARFRVVVKGVGNAVDDRLQFIHIVAGLVFQFFIFHGILSYSNYSKVKRTPSSRASRPALCPRGSQALSAPWPKGRSMTAGLPHFLA